MFMLRKSRSLSHRFGKKETKIYLKTNVKVMLKFERNKEEIFNKYYV